MADVKNALENEFIFNKLVETVGIGHLFRKEEGEKLSRLCRVSPALMQPFHKIVCCQYA